MDFRFDLVIRHGTVVTSDGTRSCDVGVTDGRIAELGVHLAAGQQEIDAAGHLVLPGGVDAHCHIAQISSTGLLTADDFFSGGVSAACGGTTTMVPFAAQHRGNSLATVVADYRAKALNAFIDYAFHLIVSDPTERVMLEELPALVRQGHSSLKVFTTYEALRLTDRQILEVLTVAKRVGALTMFHCENHDAIAWITQRFLDEGKTSPRWHPYARPEGAEREATARVIMLAETVGVPILIVHVSGAQALDEIRRARQRGAQVYAETCPQYLLFVAEDLDLPGFEGAKLMFSPPARNREGQEALWSGLADGSIDLFSSDHAPYRYDDAQGKMAHGENAPFNKVPNGVPSIGMRLPILFSEGVSKGRIDLQRFVQLTATEPARIYRLQHRKGSIAVGLDADIAIWDPAREVVVSQSMIRDRMDYSPYEGMRIVGWPVTTMSRGEVIVQNGEVRGREGRGQFIERLPPP
ncbi:MAG: dihydropyrimidinase [Gemmatimonadales bacterium]